MLFLQPIFNSNLKLIPIKLFVNTYKTACACKPSLKISHTILFGKIASTIKIFILFYHIAICFKNECLVFTKIFELALLLRIICIYVYNLIFE